MNTLTLLGSAAVALGVLLLFPVGRQVLRSCFRLDPALVTMAPALRVSCGLFLVLYAVQAVGLHEAATPAALGILLTNLSDFSEPYGERLKAMTLAAVATTLAVLLGGLVAGYFWLHLATALGVAALVGFAGAIGPRSGLVALFCLALFSLYSSKAVAPDTAFTAAGWYLAAGLLSAAVACLGWPLGRHYPTRRKLAVGFRQLAAACAERGVRSTDLRVVVALQAAAASVANSRANDETRRWLEALLDEVEACRVAAVALGQSEAPAAQEVLAAASELAREIERSLAWRHSGPRLQAALGRLEPACTKCVEPAVQPLAAALREALGNAVALLASRWPAERVARQGGAPQPGATTWVGLGALRSHLQWRDPHARHALKFAGTYAVGTVLALGPLNGLLEGHGFWIPLTVAWVCKADVAGSITRFSMRLCGTVLGVLLSALLLHFITDPELLMLLTALGAFVMGATLFANYSLTVIGATTYVLFLSATVGTYTEALADSRLVATLLGCALVLVSAYVLPSRSGTAAPVQLAAMGARLREALTQAGKPEASMPRSPLLMAVQRHRLAAVAAIAAAEAEPRAPWEPKGVALELRSLSSVLDELDAVSARLSLASLLDPDKSLDHAAKQEVEQRIALVEQRLTTFANPSQGSRI